MKIAVYEYSVRLSIRSQVWGHANAAELYVKKVLFGEDAVKVGDKPIAVVEVNPVEEAQRIGRFLDTDRFEAIFGKLSTDWAAFMKKFQYKAKAAAEDKAKAAE